MSKYLCQNCKHNNNGWCTVKKCNGLKKMNITTCNDFAGKENVVEKSKPSLFEEEDNDSQSYRVLGKREMLWQIQLQIFGINEDNELSEEDKYKELVRCIKSFGSHLEFEEQLWEVDKVVNSMIDQDMIQHSKKMTELL